MTESAPANDRGALYVVATPIGNLEDVTLRALRILGSVDLIAAEDTRHTRKLLAHHGISCPLLSYHDHNKVPQAQRLLGLLQQGRHVALVTDAGTPGIADPAYHLLQVLLPHEVPVVPVPGPSAAIAALSVSGLPMNRFVFEGFLPVKSGRRRQRLQALREEWRTIVLYESPHRFIKLLRELVENFGAERRVVVARELTKRYEEVAGGNAASLLRSWQERSVRGEFTVIVDGRQTRPRHERKDSSCSSHPNAGQAVPTSGRRDRRIWRAGGSSGCDPTAR